MSDFVVDSAEIEFRNEFPSDGPLIVARCAEDVLRWFGLI